MLGIGKQSWRYGVYSLVFLGAVVVAFLARDILSPFIVAAIFAYLLNPVVGLLEQRLKLPRTVSIVVTYLLIIGALTIFTINLGVNLARESEDFSLEARNLVHQTDSQINLLPDWIRPAAIDIFDSIRSSLVFSNRRVTSYLPGALNRSISVLIFFVATFYFLKDGHSFIAGALKLFSKEIKGEAEGILQEINQVLGNYLRGQLLLIVIMSVLTYLGIVLIGVRYALILAIFTGLAEVVPFVGPIAAAAVASIVAFTDQFSHLGPTPLLDVVAIASLYTVLRQLEDLFIIPQVMGRVTKLHPLVILFSVLVGGHLFGVVGYLVAVPLVASLKVVFGHLSA